MAGEATPLKITVIGINYAPEPTGVAPYTAGLSRGLIDRGHRVKVLTGYPHYPWWQVPDDYTGFTARESLDGVPVTRLRHYVPRRPSTLPRAVMEVSFGLRSVLARWGRPDVVLLVSPALISARMALWRARASRIPTVTWVQDIYTLGLVQTGGDKRHQRLVKGVEKSLLQGSARVVVIHDRFRACLEDELDITAPVDVVRNWSHVEAPPTTGLEQVRELHGWRPGEVVVLHAGNMGAKQGLENVVAASRVAADHGSQVRFVLLGDGNQRARLERLDPNAHLQFIDPLPDGLFEKTLAAADALLVNELPGLTEMSVPSKLTTYYATGLPVLGAVNTHSVTASELELAGAGVLVDPSDPAALVDAAERLAAAPELAASLGEAGRRFREQHLSEAAGIAGVERALLGVTASDLELDQRA